VISEFSLAAALLIDAVSFLTIAVLLALTPSLPRPQGEAQATFERLRSGLAFARRDPRIRLLLGGQSIALILFTLIIPIEVIYAKESLGTTSAGFGVLLASWGAGIVAGSILFVWLRNRSAARLILLSTAAIGLAYLGMAGAESLFVACLLSVLGGTGNGIQWVSVMTALQEATPSDYQARVVGLLESALAAMPGIGYLIGGLLTAAGSPRTAYAAAGIGTLILVLVAMMALRGLRFDHPHRREDDAEPPIAPHLRPQDAHDLSLDTSDR
jgi:predicted MFS family arabinose efflux permease